MASRAQLQKKLIRLISARADIAASLEAYTFLRACAKSDLREHLFCSMIVCYGRPFTENYGAGSILLNYPGFPDFPDSQLNIRHKRMIDLRNKFLAHSSVEGTRVWVVPPGVVNPVTGCVKADFDHNVGKRAFEDPQYVEWLGDVISAMKDRLDRDVRLLLKQLYTSKTGPGAVFELKTGFEKFCWTK
jgi:hypothetical protein